MWDGPRERNYTGTLADVFACIADRGAGGGPVSTPLEAARAALDGRNPQNAGFLRRAAYLAVVLLAAQDDCSSTDPLTDPFACVQQGVTCDGGPVSAVPATYDACAPRTGSNVIHPDLYAGFLRSLKTNPGWILVSAVAGPPTPFAVGPGPAVEPSCVTAAVRAAPAVRLDAFLRQFPARWTFTSICNDDVSDALDGLSPNVDSAAPCLHGPVDTADLDDGEPGLQLACAVTDEPLDGQAPARALPRCVAGAWSPRPCWRVEEDLASCATSDTGLVLVVDRAEFPPGPLCPEPLLTPQDPGADPWRRGPAGTSGLQEPPWQTRPVDFVRSTGQGVRSADTGSPAGRTGRPGIA